MPTLTAAERLDFERDGVIALRSAIPAETLPRMRQAIWNRLERGTARRDDPSTWGTLSGMHMKRIAFHPAFGPMASRGLCGAIDDLAGAGRWRVPGSWGMFAITAPQPGPPWEPVAEGWHADCWPSSAEDLCLFVLIHLGDTEPGGGGTLLMAGSHRAFARYVFGLTPELRARKQRYHREAFPKTSPWMQELMGLVPAGGPRASHVFEGSPPDQHGERLRLSEAHGKAGDVYLCHPFTYHVGSQNRSGQPRLMRIKMVKMTEGQVRDQPGHQSPLARSLTGCLPVQELAGTSPP